LPVRLPEDVAYDERTINPLKDNREWRQTPCPACGGAAERETDTFDTFMESSWYYARYACPDAEGAMLDGRADYWLPVDHYIGGIEHAVLHLLYARFYHKLLRDAGLVRSAEPFSRLLTQGMVVADTYFREEGAGHRHWYNPAEVQVERDDKGRPLAARLSSDDRPVQIGGIEKMSKSKNNGVDPQTLIDRFGADTVRLYTMFTAPPDQSLEWSDEGVEGAHRFLRRVWSLASGGRGERGDLGGLDPFRQALRREIHEALKQACFDYERQQFNTVVSACMKIVNALYRLGDTAADRAVLHEGLGLLLRLLGPIAPHLSHFLWRELGYGSELLEAGWPEPDPQALRQDSVQYVVQVNGKVRSRVEVAAHAQREVIEQAALADENVQRFIGGQTVRKIIVVSGKLVNIVAS
jgi:leucyl-tRNA synthetase